MMDLLRLCRLYYSIPMALTFTLTVYYARGGQMEDQWWPLALATVALGMVIAAAYVLNDVLDIFVDRINAPKRPLAANRVSRKAATILAICLGLIGILLGCYGAALVWRLWFGYTLSTVVVGLLFYDLFSKRLGIGKQWFVATLMTCIYPLALAQADGARGSRAWPLLTFAIWMFVSTYAFELLKDLRDREGDAQAMGKLNLIQRYPLFWQKVASALIVTGGIALMVAMRLGMGTIYALGVFACLIPTIIFVIRVTDIQKKIRLLYMEFILVGILTTLDVIVYGF